MSTYIIDRLRYAESLIAKKTKEEISELAYDVVLEAVESGADLLEVLEREARISHLHSEIVENLRPHVASLVSSPVSVNGVTFSVKSTGKLDYSSDATWRMIYEKEKEFAAQRKEIEAVLKKQKEDTIDFDQNTGEVFEIGHADRSAQKKTLTIKF